MHPNFLIVTERDAKTLLSANKIKRAWKRCISNPSYKICKSRLLREFSEFDRRVFII
jgi:hypothetical protein